MARKPSVNYWASRSGYGCWFEGKQYILAEGPDDAPRGPTYLAALDKFKERLALSYAGEAKDRNTVRTVLELHLQHLAAKPSISPSTVRMRQLRFKYFCEAGYGEKAIRDLTPFDVLEFCRSKRKPRFDEKAKRVCKWDDGNVRLFIDNLNAGLNWAARTGLITKNPAHGLGREGFRAKTRGRECLVSPAQHERILTAATKAFRPVIVCLEATGARPSEIVKATADAFDPQIGAFVYYPHETRKEGEHSHKTSGDEQRVRVVYLTCEALEIVKGLVRKHPTGPLFRPQMPKRKKDSWPGWSGDEINNRFRKIRDKVGVPKLTSYSYRHTFCTRWLEQGRDIERLAELVGNSPRIIRKHYAHLCKRRPQLREELEAFRDSLAGKRTLGAGAEAAGRSGPL
jgi:integrase